MKKLVMLLLAATALTACSDEVGTEAWCKDMREKPKTEWTADNAVDFAKHCVLQDGIGSEQWCEDLKEKPKGDWTANEATGFAKHCVF
ncbi:DUF3012 domain-containing protein [Vibrio rotiferianus]|uniref:DUF3012 domain-containing protein n=1 Tax=Vibrio rotiferianus TaxID=190895 RepID=UPI00111027D7|nr:DUF3012 domain-containing protein [Vibrio rotiferianus]TMX42524.1 DUF3012 domain-containing protein [Vibrio rotiferianus]TMX46346.1 DUF3012 domain-containing protein [Vibrio rotiferianus]TMX63322.1 DUF3012 domain-containing protein [Vibrio rotiferianus]TMX67579.1 DUF3012 domain-containing protein [Vibrio rotiferianus]CAH1561390.1 conserved exported hypothetical protein [Vibrio rotiferianus]